MSGYLGGGSNKTPVIQLAAIPVQTSVSTLPIPITYGQVRLSPNLTWYGNFQSSAQGGGKGSGGGKGGGGGGKGSPSSYNYSASVMLSLCEGPITGIGQVWQNKAITTVSALGMTFFNGSYSQSPWSYLTTNFPGQNLNYRGTAYLAEGNMQLDASAQLPDFRFEILGSLQLGTGASFHATIAANSTVMTVNSVTSGNIGPGQLLSNASLNPGTLIGPGGNGTGGAGKILPQRGPGQCSKQCSCDVHGGGFQPIIGDLRLSDQHKLRCSIMGFCLLLRKLD